MGKSKAARRGRSHCIIARLGYPREDENNEQSWGGRNLNNFLVFKAVEINKLRWNEGRAILIRHQKTTAIVTL